MLVSAVTFDLVGTLVRVRGSVGAQYAGMAARFGIRADAGRLDEAFPAALRGAPAVIYTGEGRDEAAGLEKAQWRAIVRQVFRRAGALAGVAAGTFDACFEALFAHFATAAAWDAYPDVRPALEWLEQRGLRLGLVTNFDGRVFPLLEDLDLARYFPVVSIPALAGCAKPGAEIFRFALDRLATPARETAHVGDALDEDAEAAGAAGLRPVWIDRHGETPPRDDIRRITTLDELPAALDD